MARLASYTDSLLVNGTKNTVQHWNISTIIFSHVSLKSCSLLVEGEPVKLEILDTSGDDQYEPLSQKVSHAINLNTVVQIC